jgi:N-acetylmuramoyl-L-alanine amidase
MAKLILELSARFPKARIFSHRDLPGVHKACPCYDVAKDYSQLNGNQK